MRQIFKGAVRKNIVRMTALCLSVSLMLGSLAGCTVKQRLEPTELHFSEVEYQRPDGESILNLIQTAQQQVKNDFFPFRIISSLKKIGKATQDFYSMMVIAQIHNYADVTNEYFSKEMDYLNIWDTRIQNQYDRLFNELQSSRFASMSKKIFGESQAEDLQMTSQASSGDILSLQEEEKKLESRYYYEFAQATVTTPEGEVLYSSLAPEGQEAYSSQFVEKYNQQLGKLFLELVSIRNQMAKKMGYSSYTEMADLQMLRSSYTRKDIKEFRENLKQTLVPVYRGYLQDFYARAENREKPGYIYLLGEPSPVPQGSWEDTLNRFQTIYKNMSQQTGECYSYLFSHEFIDAAPSTVKANITFSTLMFSLNTPFLFANMDGSQTDVSSIAHEFGHCFAMWQQIHQGSQSEGRSMDICEIHSQAMEMLTLPFYEEFYGESAGTARRYHVYTLASGILTAAMNDEFQEIVYDNPNMTIDELNQLYQELAMEYGLVVESPYFDIERFSKGWFTINQYFDTPFYAVDYALSGCVALEFLQRGLKDYNEALETYFDLVNQNIEHDFMTVLEKTELRSPFDKHNLQTLSQQLADFLQGDGSYQIQQNGQQEAKQAA